MAAKNPSSVIFWNDLENDEHLKTCSLAAKGLWDHHMLPMAARSAEPGVVLLGAHPSRLDDDLPVLLARAVGEVPDTIRLLLRELVNSGAASVDAAGRVYNRRMVREEAIRQARSAAGKKGAEATNEKRQKSGKPIGKHPAKDHDEAGGKDGGEDAGKTAPSENATSACDETTITDEAVAEVRQTDDMTAGATVIEQNDKISLSSSLHTSISSASDESVEAAACDAAREELVEPPTAAAAPEDGLDIPGFLKRSAEGPQAAMAQRDLVDEAFALWTPLAYELGIRDIGYLNAPRRTALAERLGEIGGIEGWKVFLEKVRAAQFLRKPDGRPKFWVGLGKLLEPEHFSKILEDRYAEEHSRDNDRPAERSIGAGLAGFAKAGAR